MKSFKSKDGLKIPANGTLARTVWNDGYLHVVANAFTAGDTSALKLIKVDVGDIVTTGAPVNEDRIALYESMVKSGDRLPPLVLAKTGNFYQSLDGNHRLAVAGSLGVDKLDAYVVCAPLKKNAEIDLLEVLKKDEDLSLTDEDRASITPTRNIAVLANTPSSSLTKEDLMGFVKKLKEARNAKNVNLEDEWTSVVSSALSHSSMPVEFAKNFLSDPENKSLAHVYATHTAPSRIHPEVARSLLESSNLGTIHGMYRNWKNNSLGIEKPNWFTPDIVSGILEKSKGDEQRYRSFRYLDTVKKFNTDKLLTNDQKDSIIKDPDAPVGVLDLMPEHKLSSELADSYLNKLIANPITGTDVNVAEVRALANQDVFGERHIDKLIDNNLVGSVNKISSLRPEKFTSGNWNKYADSVKNLGENKSVLKRNCISDIIRNSKVPEHIKDGFVDSHPELFLKSAGTLSDEKLNTVFQKTVDKIHQDAKREIGGGLGFSSNNYELALDNALSNGGRLNKTSADKVLDLFSNVEKDERFPYVNGFRDTLRDLSNTLSKNNHLDKSVVDSIINRKEHAQTNPKISADHLGYVGIMDRPFIEKYNKFDEGQVDKLFSDYSGGFLDHHGRLDTLHSVVYNNPHIPSAVDKYLELPVVKNNTLSKINALDFPGITQETSQKLYNSLSNDPKISNFDLQNLKEHALWNIPDIAHDVSVNTKVGTVKMRRIRDMIQEAGVGDLPPKKLPPEASQMPFARLPNGNISADKLQYAIDNQPVQKFNVSHGTWDGVQRHNEDKQKVFQVNVTNDKIQELKNAGVYDTFRKIQEKLIGSHPVTPSTIGWVRYTDEDTSDESPSKKGIFIDEIQSDHTVPFAIQAGNHAKRDSVENDLHNGFNGTPDQVQARAQLGYQNAFNEVNEEYPVDHQVKIKNILFGSTHPTKVLGESFLQHLRDTGKHNVPLHIHSLETKLPISLGPEADIKNPPAHFKETYQSLPKEWGFKPAKYGELATENEPSLKNKPVQGGIARKSEEWVGEEELLKALDWIEKVQPPSGFPKLGIENRRETPIISEPLQLKTKTRSSLSYLRSKVAENKIPADKASGIINESVRNHAASPYVGAVAAVSMPSKILPRTGYAMDTPLRDRAGLTDSTKYNKYFAASHSNPKAAIGTKQHEDFHMMMNRAEFKYGRGSRNRLAANLFYSIPQELRSGSMSDLATFGKVVNKDSQQHHEELLAKMYNYLNNPGDRELIRARIAGDLKGKNSSGEINSHLLRLDQDIKTALRHVRTASLQVNEDWVNKLQDHVLGTEGEQHAIQHGYHHDKGVSAEDRNFSKSENDVDNLLSHPDSQERALALKLHGVESRHLKHALLDPHISVWQSALNHPGINSDVLHSLFRNSHDRAGYALYNRHTRALEHPLVNESHLRALYHTYNDCKLLDGNRKSSVFDAISNHKKVSDDVLEKLGKERGLSKAVNPNEISQGVLRASRGSEGITHGVDYKKELTAHPAAHQPIVDAYREQVLNSPVKVNSLKPSSQAGIINGITPKVLYKTHVGETPSSFLVKPYTETPEVGASGCMLHPHQGWAEMTNQALYHAGGIGNLHQKVHVSEHDSNEGKHPAVVVHVEPGYKHLHDFDTEEHSTIVPKNPHLVGQMNQMAIMDFLSNNLDRHMGNFLIKKNGEQVLAIDHGRSFQYKNSDRRTQDIDRTDSLSNYSKRADDLSSSYGFGNNHDQTTQDNFHKANWKQSFDWWKNNSSNIKKAFYDRVMMIKDPDLQDHMLRNFNDRANWLDKTANSGNSYHPDLNRQAIYINHDALPNDRVSEYRNTAVDIVGEPIDYGTFTKKPSVDRKPRVFNDIPEESGFGGLNTVDGKATTEGLSEANTVQNRPPLKKALAHEDVSFLSRPTSIHNPRPVDSTAYLNKPQPANKDIAENFNGVVNSKDVLKNEPSRYKTIGVEPKAIYNTGQHRFMVKSFYGENPMSGWSEQMSQGMYHAGGIGHLIQKSHVFKHQNPGNPQDTRVGVAVHMEPNTYMLDEHKKPFSEQDKEDLGKIHVMDFLTHNTDRHGGNLIVKKDGSGVMAIDNADSFNILPLNENYGSLPDISWHNGNAAFTGSHGLKYGNRPNMEMFSNPKNVFHPKALAWVNMVDDLLDKEFQKHTRNITDLDKRVAVSKVFQNRLSYLKKLANTPDPEGGLAKKIKDDDVAFLHKEPQIKSSLGSTVKRIYSNTNKDVNLSQHNQTVPYMQYVNMHPKEHQELVDHFKTHVLNSPGVVKNIGCNQGVDEKAVFKTKQHKFMVKHFYHNECNGNELNGWREMVSQGLYHAGGIGNLHQKVHTFVHPRSDGQPVVGVAIHMEPRVKEIFGDESYPKSTLLDLNKIALMDYLTGNSDRHAGNVLMKGNRPIAIDHALSFNYESDPLEDNTAHLISMYAPSVEDHADLKRNRDVDKSVFYDQTLEWYHHASPAIIKEFIKHIKLLNHPDKVNFMRNFMVNHGNLKKIISRRLYM